MKKYIIGTLFGFALAFSITAHGEAINLIDKVVQGMFPVTVDGVSMGEAIVVENKTYLPVRSFGEAIGYKVTFSEDRAVILTKNEQSPTTQPTPANTVPTFTPPIDVIKVASQQFEKFTNVEGRVVEGDFTFIEINGSQYLNVSSFSGPFEINWKDPVSSFKSKDGKIVGVKIEGEYKNNVDGFRYQGASYVKLSVLGLKATVSDGALIINKK